MKPNPLREPAFRWGPLSARQKKVLTWWHADSPCRDHNGIIADGAIRSGKSVSMQFSFVVWAMTTFDRQNLALCGKTIASLRRNVLGTLKRQLRARGYIATERRADNLLVVTKGDKCNLFYLFGGKDESSQDLIQGITLAGAFFDEVALMPESFVNQATARCSVTGSKFWFNCNPEGPYHWFYLGWIRQCRRRKLLYLHFTMEDNLTLHPDIKARYRAQYTGVFYDRYILGLWTVAEGLVYKVFDPKRHITRTLPECCTDPKLQRMARYFISVDYGTKNPFSAGLWCFFDGKATRLAEYYYDGRKQASARTDEEHYTALEKLAGDRLIERLIIDPSAASMIETIRRHGRFRVRSANNEVVPGIGNVATLLAAGALQIHEDCKDCIREFGSYRWDEDAKEDRVIKEHDHAMDDTRYFVRTVLRREMRYLLDD